MQCGLPMATDFCLQRIDLGASFLTCARLSTISGEITSFNVCSLIGCQVPCAGGLRSRNRTVLNGSTHSAVFSVAFGTRDRSAHRNLSPLQKDAPELLSAALPFPRGLPGDCAPRDDPPSPSSAAESVSLAQCSRPRRCRRRGAHGCVKEF